MIYRAHVEGGNIIPDQPLELADGTKLEFRVVEEHQVPPNSDSDWLQSFIGCIKDLPPDASTTIDEVLYGRNKP